MTYDDDLQRNMSVCIHHGWRDPQHAVSDHSHHDSFILLVLSDQLSKLGVQLKIIFIVDESVSHFLN